MKTSCILLIVAVSSCTAMAQTTQPTTRPAVMPADQLLSQMLRPTGSAAKPLQPAQNTAVTDKAAVTAVSPSAPEQSVLREGSFLVDRIGRLNKSADNQSREFVFESDGKTLRDPPVIILPNLKLMAMEDAVAASAGRDLRFRISGILTEYRGRNYILLEKVVVVADGN